METEDKTLYLKWGTLKGWNNANEQEQKLLQEYEDIGASCSVALQRDTPKQKEIICSLIDIWDGMIWLSWDGKEATKEEAKKYVMEYRKTTF